MRWGGGGGEDAILKGEGRISGALKAIPGVGIGLRKLGIMKKADEDKARKAAEKYAGTLSKEGRTSLEGDIEGTKGVGGFVKRFAYTGPEGAFKPGKKGYEKIIGRKRWEDEEKAEYHKNLATLSGLKESDIKDIIDKGKKKELDEKIEQNTKKIEAVFAKGASVLEKIITKVDVDLREKGTDLYEAKRKGLPQADIEVIKLEIITKERQKAGLKGQEMIMDKKKKEREAIEKAVDKYETRQETEKLGAKFSSSGAGGGGKGGGGGKTTP